MSTDYDRSIAFQTACELIFKGKDQPFRIHGATITFKSIKKKINLN